MAMAVAALAVGCFGPADDVPPPEYTVRPGPFAIEVQEAGVVHATRVYSVTAPRRGQLIMIAETGTAVDAGDVVVMMENSGDIDSLNDRLNDLRTTRSELEASIERLRIALRDNTLNKDAAESELAFRRVQLEEVTTKLSETEALHRAAVVPGEDLFSAQFRTESTRLSTVGEDLSFRSILTDKARSETDRLLEIDRYALEGARQLRRVQDAHERIESSRIASPVSGMFVRKSTWRWSSGGNVEPKPGDNVRGGQVLGEIPELDSLVVRSQVPERDLFRVEVGTPVVMSFDALGGAETTGRVISIARSAIEREASAGGALSASEGYSGQKVFEVDLEMDEVNPRLRPGLTAEVRFILHREDDALAIPVEYVQREGSRTVVHVRGADGSAEPRVVELGPTNDETVLVTSGLQAGERIIQTGPRLEDDRPVEADGESSA